MNHDRRPEDVDDVGGQQRDTQRKVWCPGPARTDKEQVFSRPRGSERFVPGAIRQSTPSGDENRVFIPAAPARPFMPLPLPPAPAPTGPQYMHHSRSIFWSILAVLMAVALSAGVGVAAQEVAHWINAMSGGNTSTFTRTGVFGGLFGAFLGALSLLFGIARDDYVILLLAVVSFIIAVLVRYTIGPFSGPLFGALVGLVVGIGFVALADTDR